MDRFLTVTLLIAYTVFINKLFYGLDLNVFRRFFVGCYEWGGVGGRGKMIKVEIIIDVLVVINPSIIISFTY